MTLITETHINKLFDHLWPGMNFALDHKLTCLKNIKAINNYFVKYQKDHDKLLNSLCSLDGIGLTIASGLIWSYYPNTRVPFDKYTLTYAIREKIIPSENISSNYVNYSEKIKDFCSEYVIGNNKYTIEDFVREALEELYDSEFFIDAK